MPSHSLALNGIDYRAKAYMDSYIAIYNYVAISYPKSRGAQHNRSLILCGMAMLPLSSIVLLSPVGEIDWSANTNLRAAGTMKIWLNFEG